MASTILIFLSLLSILPSAQSHPLPTAASLSKRTPRAHTIGVGFAITLSTILLAILIFYLGVRRGRAGTWFCWRDASPSLTSTPSTRPRISCPVPIHSSALPELSPVNAPPAFAELDVGAEKAVYELGIPSPQRPLSAATQTSGGEKRKSLFLAQRARKSLLAVKAGRKSGAERRSRSTARSGVERKSWFCRSALEVEDEERRLRRGERGSEELPAYPGPVVIRGEQVEGEVGWVKTEGGKSG